MGGGGQELLEKGLVDILQSRAAPTCYTEFELLRIQPGAKRVSLAWCQTMAELAKLVQRPVSCSAQQFDRGGSHTGFSVASRERRRPLASSPASADRSRRRR